MTDLALRSDHPHWFRPLFAASDEAGLGDLAIHVDGRACDPAARPKPAPVVLHRIEPLSFLRRPPTEERACLAVQAREAA